jgi:hypothetical protein
MARHEKLNLQNLILLDFGKIPAAFDTEMSRVVKDCMDRPLDDKARKVAIVFTVRPKSEAVDAGTGAVDCDRVSVEAEIQSTVPKRRTKVYDMLPKQDGTLMFHPDLAEEPDGSTLYDEDAEEADHRKIDPGN